MNREVGESSQMNQEIERRKGDHLAICANENVGFRSQTTLLECVRLIHDSVPELALTDIDLSVLLFGKKLRAPLMIAAMTGGTEEAARVNQALAAIAERRGYGFGVGSQRPMMKVETTRPSFQVRDVAPTTLVLSNLGAVQAVSVSSTQVASLVQDIGADALCLHLNPAMELVQTEGDRNFRGVLDTFQRLIQDISVPILAKETGCGIGPIAAQKLRSVGVNHVDVSGAGGTSWVGVETYRARDNNEGQYTLGQTFWDWGIPTAVSTAMCSHFGFATIIATGGISSGLDVARSIVLGASSAGLARPVLKAFYTGGESAVHHLFDRIEMELKTAMLLVGAKDIASLKKVPRLITGELRDWLQQFI